MIDANRFIERTYPKTNSLVYKDINIIEAFHRKNCIVIASDKGAPWNCTLHFLIPTEYDYKDIHKNLNGSYSSNYKAENDVNYSVYIRMCKLYKRGKNVERIDKALNKSLVYRRSHLVRYAPMRTYYSLRSKIYALL